MGVYFLVTDSFSRRSDLIYNIPRRYIHDSRILVGTALGRALRRAALAAGFADCQAGRGTLVWAQKPNASTVWFSRSWLW
jgi:hypothetical protein